MVIDNSKKSSAKAATFSNHTDTSVPTSIYVTSTADEDTKKVARNIEQVKVVANNITEVIYIATTFENTVKKVTDANYNGKSATDILNEANTKFTTNVLNEVAKLNNLTNEISTCANLEGVMTSLDGMKTVLNNLDANIVDIQEVGGAIDNVNVVAALEAAIQTTVQMETELLAIYDRLNELQTIYHYLPEILRTYTYLVDLDKARQALNFTTEEYLDSLLKIGKNIESLLNVAFNIDDLVAVKVLLENAPNLLQQIKDELDNLLVTYTTQLDDKVTEGKRELEIYVADIKIEMGKILASLRAGAGAGGGGGGAGITVDEVFDAIKKGNGIVLTRDNLRGTLTISSVINEIVAKDASILVEEDGNGKVTLSVPNAVGNNAKPLEAKDDTIVVDEQADKIVLSGKKYVEGNNITFETQVDGSIKIVGQAGGSTEVNDWDNTLNWVIGNPPAVNPNPGGNPTQDFSGTINNFDVTQTWNLDAAITTNGVVFGIGNWDNTANW